jgi:hypothetical protein
MTAPTIDPMQPVPVLSSMCRALITPWRLMLKRGLAKARIRAEALGPVEMLRTVDTDAGGYKVTVTGGVPRELELDFLQHRGHTYVETMGNGVADEFAAMLTGRNAPEPFDEKTLKHLCLHTVMANVVSHDPSRDLLVADFTAARLDTFTPTYVTHFEFGRDDTRFAVVTRDGKRYTPASPEWPTALLHVMAQCTVYPPMAAHNWVHFQFPDVIGAAVFELRDSDSALLRLLRPHVRFTNRVNYQAIWVQRSTSNGPGYLKKLAPWYCMPLEGPRFRDGVIFNTGRHYDDVVDHFRMPDRLDTSIPYLGFLKSYFDVVESFVRSCDPHLEPDVYDRFAALVEPRLPGFASVDRVRALSVFIWQVGVYHVTDHLTMLDYGMRHGFTTVPGPVTRTMTLRDVGAYDRYRTRNFMRIFVNFTPSPTLDQRLENIDAYGFAAGSPLRQSAERFRADLQAVDRRHEAAGTRALPLARMIQSICF